MNESVIIRPIERNEISRAVRMGSDHFIECQMIGKFDPEYMTFTLNHVLDGGAGIILGAFESDILIGYIWGIAFPHFYTGDLEAMAMSWYLIPGRRGGDVAIEMLKKFEDFCREKDCKRMYVGCMENEIAKKFRRVFERNGFREYEIHFVKEF